MPVPHIFREAVQGACRIGQLYIVVILTGQPFLHGPIIPPHALHVGVMGEGVFLLHTFAELFGGNHTELPY